MQIAEEDFQDRGVAGLDGPRHLPDEFGAQAPLLVAQRWLRRRRSRGGHVFFIEHAGPRRRNEGELRASTPRCRGWQTPPVRTGSAHRKLAVWQKTLAV
jgi:hypothetical protein